MKKQLKKGFTLTELVIVIVIIAILAAVLIPSMTGYVNRARKSSNEQTAESIATVYAAWLIDESDKLSYAYQDKTTGKANGVIEYKTAADVNAFNAKLAGAISDTKAMDAKPTTPSGIKDSNIVAKYYLTEAGASTLGEGFAKDDEVKLTNSGKTVTLATNSTVTKELSDAFTEYTTKYFYEADYVNGYNATLNGAVKKGDTNFTAYYLVASDYNTNSAEGIGDVSATGFTYTGSKYKTVVKYENGAFSYETSDK